MTEYECRNPNCHMHKFLSRNTLYQCPVCQDGSDEDLVNISEEKEYQASWNEEIAREAAAMYGQQAYLDHMNVSFEVNECFGCGAPCEGTRCEYC